MSGDIVQYCRTRKRMREVIAIIDEVSDRLDSKGEPGFVPPVPPAGPHPDDKDDGVSG